MAVYGSNGTDGASGVSADYFLQPGVDGGGGESGGAGGAVNLALIQANFTLFEEGYPSTYILGGNGGFGGQGGGGGGYYSYVVDSGSGYNTAQDIFANPAGSGGSGGNAGSGGNVGIAASNIAFENHSVDYYARSGAGGNGGQGIGGNSVEDWWYPNFLSWTYHSVVVDSWYFDEYGIYHEVTHDAYYRQTFHGGDGGDGGNGGSAGTAQVDFNANSVSGSSDTSDLFVQLSARGESGGQGGYGGGAGSGNPMGAAGSGGTGGRGGDAAISAIGNHISSDYSTYGWHGIYLNANAGDGGAGGGGGHGSHNASSIAHWENGVVTSNTNSTLYSSGAPGGHGGNGGNASITYRDNVVTLGDFNDILDLSIFLHAGKGGNGGYGGNSGDGSTQAASGASGSDGIATLDFSGNSFDGGAGHDTLNLSGIQAGYSLDANDMLAPNGDAEFDVIVNLQTGLLQIGEGINSISNFEDVWVESSYVFGSSTSKTTTLIGDANPNAFASGQGNDTLIGADGNDLLLGNGGDDSLDGGAGDDTLYGGGGADSIIGGNGRDYIDGDSGNDQLFGQEGNDTLLGGEGNDYLDGGAGTDSLDGGNGHDSYVVNSAADVITDSAGSDTIYASTHYTLQSFIENLQLTGTAHINGYGNAGDNYVAGNDGNNNLYGQDGNDTIYGLDGHDSLGGGNQSDALYGGNGNDTLNGGSSTDTVMGNDGNDIYYLTSDASDTLVEAALEGTDLVYSSFNLTLGTNFENLTLTGTGNINGTGNTEANVMLGNSGNNTFFGREGNDTLNGGGGTDNLRGGLGDDTYLLQVDTLDTILETAGVGTGFDTVLTAFNYTLGANLEGLTLTGSGNTSGTGNANTNTMHGNNGHNGLFAQDGNDWLFGWDGNDTLSGGNGADQLSGMNGVDRLVGGANNDTFMFNNLTEMGIGAGNRDVITDFSHAQGDLIHLDGLLLADTFVYRGVNAFTGTDQEVRYFQSAGTTIVEIDTDGNGAANAEIQFSGLIGLVAGDFTL
jgi:Ca2+-binding RTX toxin-like protein